MSIDIKSLEKEMGMREEDNELFVVYKGSDISSNITGMINRSELTDKIVSRKIIFDVIGSSYNVLYTINTDTEKICDGLLCEIMGVSLKELRDERSEYLKMKSSQKKKPYELTF